MYHPLKAETIEKIIATQQTSAPQSFDLRRELNATYTAQMMIARGVRNSRNPKDIAMRERAEAYMAELAEQLTLLDAIEFGFIEPIMDESERQAAEIAADNDWLGVTS